ncbi:MAG: dienelactone hydrolase family protein [Deltaproteobacteria bacterium]|nr:dienelactone hydrolase family protein [Deltaproteobacteria bacterium]
MTQRVTIPTTTGEVSAVLTLPAGDAKAPAVVVLQEWWGVNDQLLSIASKWAAAGFVAIVPDLYHGKVIPIGNADEAGVAMKALDFGKAVGEIGATVAYLKEHARCTGKVAVTGYCMGGALTLATAVNVRGLAAAVPFYGLPGDLDWSKIDVPVQAHFAKTDDWATVAGAEKVKAGVKTPMQLHVYDAQHAFCNDQRPDVYDAEACAQAWDRTVEFVRAHTA